VFKILLVSGITGHTGSYFLEELVKHEYSGKIRCIIRESSNTSKIDNCGLNIEKAVGSLEDKEFLAETMRDAETMLHIYNIHHSVEIVKLALSPKSNVKRLILVHTTGIYSKFKMASENYINIEKKISELQNEASKEISITILRPTMIYGDLLDKNVSEFIKMVDRLSIMPVIDGGKNLIQPVHASDLGSAYYQVLMNLKVGNGRAYNLSGQRPIQMKSFLTLISNELNKKTIFIHVPLYAAETLAKTLKIFSFNKIDYVEKVQRMSEDRSFKNDEAIRDFNYNPIFLDEGIKNEVSKYLGEKSK
jgi:nucleoside-diphosphate-sugar epimerase